MPPLSAPPREVYISADAAVPVVVGAACDVRAPCGPGLACEPWPGGYCSGPCAGCTGVCVEQVDRALCLASCTTDADCRASEGYACDPTWHACALANTSAIVPATCPAPVGFGRDPAFAPPITLGDVEGSRDPAAVVTDKGDVLVLYSSTYQNKPMLHLAWDKLVGAPFDAAWYPNGEQPSITRQGTRLYAVWTAANRIVLQTGSTDGSAFLTPPGIDVADPADCNGTAHCVDHPVVAVGADPQKQGAAIVYVGYVAGDGFRIRTSRDGGASFAPAKTALPGIRGALAIDAKGVVYAVTLRSNPRAAVSADSRIDLAISYDGGRSFTRPQTISRYAEQLPQSNPRIEVDSNRKILYVAYARGGRDAKWDLVLAAYKQTAYKPAWSYARIGDDPACAIHMAPAIAIDPVTGALHASWYDSRGNRVAHGVCTEGLGQCRQLGRINDAPLSGLSLSRGSPRAVGDNQALVVDWQRRALHAVWTQPTAEGGPRILHAKAKLPVR